MLQGIIDNSELVHLRDRLPAHAQEIFKGAFNSAWYEYVDPDKRRGHDSQEEVVFKTA